LKSISNFAVYHAMTTNQNPTALAAWLVSERKKMKKPPLPAILFLYDAHASPNRAWSSQEPALPGRQDENQITMQPISYMITISSILVCSSPFSPMWVRRVYSCFSLSTPLWSCRHLEVFWRPQHARYLFPIHLDLPLLGPRHTLDGARLFH